MFISEYIYILWASYFIFQIIYVDSENGGINSINLDC